MDSSPFSFPATDHVEPAARRTEPTRVRWKVIALLTSITSLTYLDRLNLGIAGKFIQDEFSISTPTMGWILSAFVLGYALCQVPGGWLGDKYGPRGVLTLAIVWWSILTAATAIAPRLPLARWFGLAWSFALVRFLIGMGEATALPNANKIISFWVGAGRRGVANSIFLMGVGVGGIVTPPLVAGITQRWGWRASFHVCALVGILIALAWRLYATNRPHEHQGVNALELAIIGQSKNDADTSALPNTRSKRRPPWRKMFSSLSVWGLILSYACEGYPNYIYYTWFFIYLVRVRGLRVTQGSMWAATPFLAVILLAPLGGLCSDRAVARFGKRRGRQYAAWLGMALSAAFLFAGAHTAKNSIAILLLAGALGFNIFATASWWAVCIDLTRNFSGSLSGLMNTCGNLGGWVSPILTAYIASRVGWTQALDFAAVVTLAAGLLWVFINADQNLESERRSQPR